MYIYILSPVTGNGDSRRIAEKLARRLLNNQCRTMVEVHGFIMCFCFVNNIASFQIGIEIG
jgi:hypothetical protein